MIVKVSKTIEPNVAIMMTLDGTMRIPLLLDDTLRNKMCRRDRAYFNAAKTEDGEVALFKRLPNQGW